MVRCDLGNNNQGFPQSSAAIRWGFVNEVVEDRHQPRSPPDFYRCLLWTFL